MTPAQLRHGCLLCLAAALPAAALAGDWSVGASVGQSRIDVSGSDVEQAFQVDDGFVATGTRLDRADVGWKAWLGYRPWPLLGIEAGYADLGEATFDTTIVDAPPPLDGSTPFSIKATATAEGPQLAGVLHVPLSQRFALLAKAGAFRWKARYTERFVETGALRLERTEQDTDLLYGAGVEVALAGSLGTRLEWERLQDVGRGIGGRNGRDVDFISVGVRYEF